MAFCCSPPPHSFSLLFNHVITFFYTPHNTIWPLRSTLFPKDNLLGALQVDPWTTDVNYMGPLTSGIFFFFNKYNPPFASMYFTCEDSTSQMENSIFAFFLVSFKLVFPTADWKYCFQFIIGWIHDARLRNMRAVWIFTKKYLSISGPMHFKVMLFKGPLYWQWDKHKMQQVKDNITQRTYKKEIIYSKSRW